MLNTDFYRPQVSRSQFNLAMHSDFSSSARSNTFFCLHFDTEAANVRFGKWSQTEKIYSDMDGGFPLVVFNSTMKTAVVLSPLTSFMASLQTSFTDDSTNDTMLTFGPLNTFEEVCTLC